eukprot:Gregarina_sp_Poly_1__6073@NODE_3203_length_1277_cov_269_560331_g2034_i0_p1_GENE_NODE_3203_length_1277_cov_269_560331_g2034_i0NODE_3203_length_1277_cov_269_560331_g2034_i0_p1_ORF_typecomplete_len306_score21_49_NODE_3203_length_1277_cov_269_560331_g2034_i060977
METRSSHNILTGSYNIAVGAGNSLIAGLESRSTGVSRLRHRIEPYTAQASEGLMMAAETADRLVVDPLVEEYSAGGSQAVLIRLFCMFKDISVGFIAGICSRSALHDDHEECENRHDFAIGTKATDDSGENAPPLGTYLLSKVDSLFYFPLVITLRSRAASVFAQDPRQTDSHSYVYCLGWELGSWVVEWSSRLWNYFLEHSPFNKGMHLLRKVTALEVNFSGLGDCLARRVPPSVHPFLSRMSRLRQVYSCERRAEPGSGVVQQNFYTPTLTDHSPVSLDYPVVPPMEDADQPVPFTELNPESN